MAGLAGCAGGRRQDLTGLRQHVPSQTAKHHRGAGYSDLYVAADYGITYLRRATPPAQRKPQTSSRLLLRRASRVARAFDPGWRRGRLTFEPLVTRPKLLPGRTGLGRARRPLAAGGTDDPTAFNAANEVAVSCSSGGKSASAESRRPSGHVPRCAPGSRRRVARGGARRGWDARRLAREAACS